jgi:protein-arginine kinase activator protein McsA
MPLKFELDHINGNRQDESRKNLRLVCPNCHSQTETYKVGNNKQVGKVQYTDEQVIQALKENTSGYNAIKSLGMNPHGGNYVRVRRIIKEYNLELSYTV